MQLVDMKGAHKLLPKWSNLVSKLNLDPTNHTIQKIYELSKAPIHFSKTFIT